MKDKEQRDWLALARQVLETEIEGLYQVRDNLGREYERALEMIAGSPGRVFVTGIGKSGLVGRKIAATLSSTGTPASFLHPVEGAHGDLGMIKEQDLLFTALEMKGMSRRNSPIGLLIREHEIARNYIKNMERALEDYKRGDDTAGKDIAQNASVYIELLHQHINKEDDLLYPMAEKELSDSEKREIADAYERFESEIVGEGVHERYHHMIEDLKARID